MPRLSAAVLATSLVPTTLAGHRFWEAPAETRQQQQLHFFKNLSLLGGLLIAAGDTDGQARRRLAHPARGPDARRGAGHLAGTARREARLAKAQLT